jgi:PAS domain S-box-containing protein
MGIVALDLPAVSCATWQAIPGTGVIIADPDLRIVHADGPAIGKHGYQATDWAGRLLVDVLPGDLMRTLEPHYRAALAGEHQSFDYWSDDGSRAYWAQITPIRGEEGTVTLVMAVMQDVTERVRLVEQLSVSEVRLQESERMVGVGSWELVLETDVITYSGGFARLLGLSAGEPLTGGRLMRLIHREDHAIVTEAFADCLRVGSSICEYRVNRRDGAIRTISAQSELVPASGARSKSLRGTILDVTDARVAERERLEAVTLFQQSFDASPIGMVLSDPVQWRCVRANDAMCRMLGCSRESLIGVTVDSVTHPDDRDADHRSRRAMLAGTLTSLETEKRYLRPDGGVIWVTLHVTPVRAADGSVQAFFSQVIDITERKEHEARFEQDVNDAFWLGRIREAIDDDRLVLYSQPIVDLRSGETVQQELLLRMRGEDGSIIAPGDFLPIAERFGLMSEIDRWVIRQAVGLAAQGQHVEFNLSAMSIGDPDVLLALASALEQTGADPSLVVVEVTETAMMMQLDTGRKLAEQLTALGCGLALDDFGTGYGSLNYLKHIPAQYLKIDMEFVRDLTRNETDERVIRGIVGLAREFEQTTIAEGIEDESTLVLLRDLGVHLGQGYLFGRPAPLPDHTAGTPRLESQAPGSDSVSIVRRVFEAFATRDFAAAIELCHPEIVIRPHPKTTELTGRHEPYRGHEDVLAYANDVAAVWKTLNVTPTVFRPAAGTVIVFGRADIDSGIDQHSEDVLWVWRLRDGLVTSVDIFAAPSHERGRLARPGDPT